MNTTDGIEYPFTKVIPEIPFIGYFSPKPSGIHGIVGTGKCRKKKQNRIHRSRMLRRKHAKKSK